MLATPALGMNITIDRILGTFGGQIYARDEAGNLYETELKPVMPIDPEFTEEPWLTRKTLTQACLHSKLFAWTRSDSDGGNNHKFDVELRQQSRERSAGSYKPLG